MSHWISHATCDHEWVADYDAVADQAAYNDGLNYSPAFEVCTKCGRSRRIQGERRSWLGFAVSVPVMLIGVAVIELLSVLALLAELVRNALFPRDESSP
jgi:hypothetical protein